MALVLNVGLDRSKAGSFQAFLNRANCQEMKVECSITIEILEKETAEHGIARIISRLNTTSWSMAS